MKRPLLVHDARRSAHLGFNVFLYHLRPRRQQRRKFRVSGLPPHRFLGLRNARNITRHDCKAKKVSFMILMASSF
jgi:hypothetical protein